MDSYPGGRPQSSSDLYGSYPSHPNTGSPPQLSVPPLYGQQKAVYQAPVNSPFMAQGQVQPTIANQRQAELPTELTQEDYLFLKKWKNDSFYQRGLPIMALTCGAQYYYNKTKQLPHSWFKYTSLIVTSYFVGIFTFRNEFKRRIATSPSNTQFMQKARLTLGLPALAGGEGVPSFDSGYETPMDAGPDAAVGLYSADNYSTNPARIGGSGNMALGYNENLNADWTNDNTVNSPASLYATTPPVAPSNLEHFNPLPPDPNHQINNQNDRRDGLTYDELRARNRGLIR